MRINVRAGLEPHEQLIGHVLHGRRLGRSRHPLGGVVHRGLENVKLLRAVGLRHHRVIQSAQQFPQGLPRRQIPELHRGVVAGAGFHKNMPAGLVRDVFQQRPEGFAMKLGADPVALRLPDQGIRLRRAGADRAPAGLPMPAPAADSHGSYSFDALMVRHFKAFRQLFLQDGDWSAGFRPGSLMSEPSCNHFFKTDLTQS